MSDTLNIEFARGVTASEIEIVAAAVHGATMPLDPADISRPSLRLIFEAALDLDRRGQIVSAVEIVALLRSWDTLRGLTLDGGLDLIVADDAEECIAMLQSAKKAFEDIEREAGMDPASINRNQPIGRIYDDAHAMAAAIDAYLRRRTVAAGT